MKLNISVPSNAKGVSPNLNYPQLDNMGDGDG